MSRQPYQLLHVQHKLLRTRNPKWKASLMAHTTAQSYTIPAVLRVVADIFAGIFGALSQLHVANAKVRQIEALTTLSDEELNNRGLKRADIIRHVMSEKV